MTMLNDTKTRAITEAACGVACYEGAVEGTEFHGLHRGVCRDWDDARAWLRGETPASLIRVYPLVMVRE